MNSLIPTNIITGFLGVGKTTAITYLLNNKPEAEVWSILVNEFGEIGIDGAMLKPLNAHVREVPGGCICCVAGLPMKIALNMMIAKTKPDRIIIEPTGLGHAEDIIKILTGDYYDSVLDLRASITLVDPRKLSDPRYSDNATFREQIAVADVLVANKTDICNESDRIAFDHLLRDAKPSKLTAGWVEQGRLDFAWLDMARSERVMGNSSVNETNKNRLSPSRDINTAVTLPPDKAYVRRENQAGGFYSCGWLFRPDIQFDFNHLFGWLSGINVLRTKAVMHTNQGVFIFNAENNVLSVNRLDVESTADILDSRLELISREAIDTDSAEKELLSTIIAPEVFFAVGSP